MNPHIEGLLGRGIDPSEELYLHRATQHKEMPLVGFDLMIPVF